jgi:hypothetical protein
MFFIVILYETCCLSDNTAEFSTLLKQHSLRRDILFHVPTFSCFNKKNFVNFNLAVGLDNLTGTFFIFSLECLKFN